MKPAPALVLGILIALPLIVLGRLILYPVDDVPALVDAIATQKARIAKLQAQVAILMEIRRDQLAELSGRGSNYPMRRSLP